MATTTNYSWTTPDDTDLVKDGAAAIRTLGSSIDTSFVAMQGDLLLGGTSDIFEPLAIGTLPTVLTSDGTHCILGCSCWWRYRHCLQVVASTIASQHQQPCRQLYDTIDLLGLL
jgi:hypothetical protein